MNNSSKTDHASTPLGIFASKNLAAWLPSRLAAKKSAFTLAEVLITLGIIGVVAALTIPSVVSHYKKQEVVTKLKTVESLFSQMLNFSIAENGDPQNWDLAADNGTSASAANYKKSAVRITEKYFLPYLKTSNYYGFVSLKNAGYPIYYRADGGVQKWNLDTLDSETCIIELPNEITVFLRPDVTTNNTLWNLLVYVDINGKKAPNIWGRDMFLAEIFLANGKFKWEGLQHSNWSRDTLKNSCSPTASLYCGALIWLDGYEIKSDYPIRI